MIGMKGPPAGVFMYFLPGTNRTAATVDEFKKRGLTDRIGECISERIAGHSAQITDLIKGPSGGAGTLVVPMPADGSIVDHPDYFPDHQTWHESQDGSGVWLGYDNRHPPNARGLARRKQTPGYSYDLLDNGDLWECPIIRRCFVLPQIPVYWTSLNGPDLVRRPMPEYEQVWANSQHWITEEITGGMSAPAAIECATQCLALNYRVGLDELSALRLLVTGPTGPIRLVIEAALDFPWLRAAQSGDDPEKKKTYETIRDEWANSWRGLADFFPTTDRATAT